MPMTAVEQIYITFIGWLLLTVEPTAGSVDCCAAPYAPKTCYSGETTTYDNVSTYECYSVGGSNWCQSCILSSGYDSGDCSSCCAYECTACGNGFRTSKVYTGFFSTNYMIEAFIIMSILICCLFCVSGKESGDRRRRRRDREVMAHAYYTDDFQQGQPVGVVPPMHQQQPEITHLTAHAVNLKIDKDEDQVVAGGSGGGVLGYGNQPLSSGYGNQPFSAEAAEESTTATATSPLLSGPL